jgi:hypothetical protein
MSIAEAVPEGIKDRECERFALQEHPPVLYVPEKDPVQETISLIKSDQSPKTTIGVDAELRLPIWHCGTHEAFLMHLSSALDAIKKQGTFKAYKEAHEAYVEHREVAKQAKADMALFTTPTSKGEKASKKAAKKASGKASKKAFEKTSKKASGKNCSEKEKASQKTKEGAALSDAPAPDLCEEYKALYAKAMFAKETAKNKKEATATKMFQFYANLLSLDVKYAWNKIVREQMEADPYKDIKGVSRKGPRGFCVSHSTNALYSTFSLCFPIMQRSKKNTTFSTCSRSPRGLAHASSYSA